MDWRVRSRRVVVVFVVVVVVLSFWGICSLVGAGTAWDGEEPSGCKPWNLLGLAKAMD